MQKWIISAKGKIYDHAAAFAKYGFIDWTQRANYSVGDEVYIYCARPLQKIMYKTKVIDVSIPYESITDDKEFWHDITRYEQAQSGRYARLKLIEQADNENLSLNKLKEHGLKAAPQSAIKMSKELAAYVDQFLNDYTSSELDVPSNCYEGAKYSVVVNKYERSSIARMKCIKKYGCKCIVCGMDFEQKYGEIGKGFIHIHHVVPIAKIGKEYKVDYEKDLVPVCPNCHAMLHHSGDGTALTVDELKEIMNNIR